MRKFSLSPAFFLFFLVACASHGELSAPVPSASWTDHCFVGFEQAVQSLAGPQAVDCGFNTGEAGLACARSAIEKGQAFRLGIGGIGHDSYICSVAAKNSDGQIFHLVHDSDVTGRMDSSGENSALWVERCDTLKIRRKWLRGSPSFTVKGCEEDEDLAEAIASNLRRHER